MKIPDVGELVYTPAGPEMVTRTKWMHGNQEPGVVTDAGSLWRVSQVSPVDVDLPDVTDVEAILEWLERPPEPTTASATSTSTRCKCPCAYCYEVTVWVGGRRLRSAHMTDAPLCSCEERACC